MRTPGAAQIFECEREWPFHCRDAMRYLGAFNHSEWGAASELVSKRLSEERAAEGTEAFAKAYLELMRPFWSAPLRFECLHCGERMFLERRRSF